MTVKLTVEEAEKFHEWLKDQSSHKWEIMDELDKIMGNCPDKKTGDRLTELASEPTA